VELRAANQTLFLRHDLWARVVAYRTHADRLSFYFCDEPGRFSWDQHHHIRMRRQNPISRRLVWEKGSGGSEILMHLHPRNRTFS